MVSERITKSIQYHKGAAIVMYSQLYLSISELEGDILSQPVPKKLHKTGLIPTCQKFRDLHDLVTS